MDNPTARRDRQVRRLQDALNELNLALVECDYNPDSATQEEQVIVGIIATLSLMKRDLQHRVISSTAGAGFFP